MAIDLAAQIKSLKVTDETLQWLRWKAICTNKSHNELAREALHILAVNEMERVLHEATLLKSLKACEGSSGEAPGKLRALNVTKA
jgi:hypothetical protein